MKRCVSCGYEKYDIGFPSPGALTCNQCLITASAIMPPSDFTYAGVYKPVDPEPPVEMPEDDRPLIDQVHEATFTEPVTLRFIKDKYALRMMLRKAHRFMLDETTSSLVGDFSLAVAKDLEAARRLAVPPFPVTWFEIDNKARMRRTRELGIKVLEPDADYFKGAEFGPVIERCGWLIHPNGPHGYAATYFARAPSGVFALPMAYCWHTSEPDPVPYPTADMDKKEIEFMQWMAFGTNKGNVHPSDAHPFPSSLHFDVTELKRPPRVIMDMMVEMAGEMRHIWGLLIALGAGQLGVEADTSGRVQHNGAPKTMPNGKPLLALEHKVLHLHLAKRSTPGKVLLRAISHHKNRWHEVRSHWRTYKNEDGSVRRRTLIQPHERGDERLGRIEKTYRIER